MLIPLIETGLYPKLRSSRFVEQDCEYLQNFLRLGEPFIDSEKTATAFEAADFRAKTKFWFFRSLSNFPQSFEDGYHKISDSLTEPFKKSPDTLAIRFFRKEQLVAFQVLNKSLASPSVPKLLRLKLLYTLDTDAPYTPIGCALMQTHENFIFYPSPELNLGGAWNRSAKTAARTPPQCLSRMRRVRTQVEETEDKSKIEIEYRFS